MMANKCNLRCLECKYDDCVNDEEMSELELYLSEKARTKAKKLTGYNFSMKTIQRAWYLRNKDNILKKQAEYKAKRRKERAELRLCYLCGEKLNDNDNHINCEKCRRIIVERNHRCRAKKEKKENEQSGKKTINEKGSES